MALRTTRTQTEFDQLVEKILPLKQGFEFLDDHVVITDEHANILYANKAVERNTGFTLEEVLGKNPGDLWGGQMPKEFYQHMWEVIKVKKQPFVAEVQNQKKDGTLYWQALHISPILGEKGEVKFFIAIEPNITEQKEKEEFSEEFVAVLGHQLKSPLTTIKWIVELLLSDSHLT
jgi:two-component system sensor histidine kinase/response regulator